MEEVWKPAILRHKAICDYEVSNQGRIRNSRTKRLIKPHLHNTGYLVFNYSYEKDGKKIWTTELWHRIVAKVWIPNPDDLPQVDHIDRDMYNNHPSNLRWVSPKENSANTTRGRRLYSRYRPAATIDREGNVIKEYPSLLAACQDVGIRVEHALEMLHGRRPPRKWGSFKQDAVDKKKK